MLGTVLFLFVTGVCSEQEKRSHFCRCDKLLGDIRQLEERKSTVWPRKWAEIVYTLTELTIVRAADRRPKYGTGKDQQEYAVAREHWKRCVRKGAQIQQIRAHQTIHNKGCADRRDKDEWFRKEFLKTRSQSPANGKLGLCDDFQAKVRNVKLT